MGFQYKQISIEERCEIARLRAAGSSLRQIAANLDRAPSSVARELKRNESRSSHYLPSYAHQQTRARRWSGSRLGRDAGLRQRVLSRLTQGWSPQQVAGRLAREAGHNIISYESIYRFIYAQIARKKNYSWRHYLPRAKSKRGYFRSLKPPIPLLSSALDAPSQNVLTLPRIVEPQAIGKPTLCSSAPTVRPYSPSTSATLVSY